MKRDRQLEIRQVLTDNPDGLRVVQIAEKVGIKFPNHVSEAIRLMPDVYVDRWERMPGGGGVRGYAPIYCRAIVPENCPHPKEMT